MAVDYGLLSANQPQVQPYSAGASILGGMQTGQDMAFKEQQTKNAKLTNSLQQMSAVNNLAGSVAFAPPEMKEQAYNYALRQAKAAGLDVSSLPPTWGPDADAAVQSAYFNSGSALERMKAQVQMNQAQALMGKDVAQANYYSIKSGGSPLFPNAGAAPLGGMPQQSLNNPGNSTAPTQPVANGNQPGNPVIGQPSPIAQVAQDTESAKEQAKAWQELMAKSQGAAVNNEYNKAIINQTDQAVDKYDYLPTGKFTGGLRQFTDQDSAQLIDKNSALIQQSMVKQLVQGGGLGKIMQAENTMIMKSTPDNYKTKTVNHKIDDNLFAQNELVNNLQPKLLMGLNALGPAYQNANLAGNVMDEILTRAKLFDLKTGDVDKAALNKLPSIMNDVLGDLKQGKLKFTNDEVPTSAYRQSDVFQGIDKATGKPVSGTFSQLEEAAKANNMSVDAFINKHNLSPAQQQNNQQPTVPPQGQNVTRGIRNNNPGNIVKTSTPWNGEVQGNDNRFKTFATPQAGINAMSTLLDRYYNNGRATVADIISKWAPSSENNTLAYIKDVAKNMGVSATQKLNLSDANVKATLIKAIMQHENGHVPYDDNLIMGAL